MATTSQRGRVRICALLRDAVVSRIVIISSINCDVHRELRKGFV